jgi:hypothetical protein
VATDLYDDDWADHCGCDMDDCPECDSGCTFCGGEGWTECDDPIQCMGRHIGNDWDSLCECKACGGSGLAKDQTVW